MSGGIVHASNATLPTLTEGQTSLPSLDQQGRARVVAENNGLPVGATPVINAASAANATCSAGLSGAAGKTTYVQGFTITGLGATGATTVIAALFSLLGSVTFNYDIAVPAGVGLAIPMIVVTFQSAIPANAPNSSIQISVPAFGAGNTQVHVTIWGYQL